ncbi:MAG: hypothetical protein HZB92_03180 [Euryarchaeota archaeon]|nr:hypothetical protein [Euryarchaeota archaeon]
MMSLEHFALLVAIGAFFAIEVYRNDRLRRHVVAIPASTHILLRET